MEFDWGTFWIAGIIALVLGIAVGGWIFAGLNDVEVADLKAKISDLEAAKVEIIPDCPKCPDCPVCEVNEVEVETDYLTPATDELLNYLDDEDKLKCSGDEYSLSEVSISKVYDEYSVEFDEDKYIVTARVKIRFDEDDERSCYKKYDFKVTYEEDEDPVVTIL